MSYEIEARSLQEQTVIAKHAKLPPDAIADWLPRAYGDLFGHLEEHGVPPAGPPYARYEMGEEIVVEAGVPVPGPVPAAGDIGMSSLPATRAATLLYVGRYEDLTGAYRELERWIAEHGHEPTGLYWEVYLTDPATTADPSQARTMMFMPFR